MDKCTKKSFNSMQEANIRCGEINKLNSKNKRKNKPLRPYLCESCGSIHLTSMGKHQFKYLNNKDYRANVNLKSLLKTEVEYWENKLLK